MRKFGPNVIGFQLATGARRWYIVGCYLAPDDTLTIERVIEALSSWPKGAELLVAGDQNANLAAPEGDRRAKGNCNDDHNRGSRGNGATLPAAGAQVVSESVDVGDASERKGGAVPDGIHPGDGPLSLQECRCLGLRHNSDHTWSWVACRAPP